MRHHCNYLPTDVDDPHDDGMYFVPALRRAKLRLGFTPAHDQEVISRDTPILVTLDPWCQRDFAACVSGLFDTDS
jgi:hypothetical protein